MRIEEICGGLISLKFEKELDLEKISNFFKEFEIIYKSQGSIKLKKERKEVMIFKHGEILFYNFEKKEILSIAENLKNV